MRILWLSQYKNNWDFNKWFHIDFAYEIAKQPDVELKTYGYRMTMAYPKLDLQKFYPNTAIEKVKEKFNFDIIIIDGKARVTLGRGRREQPLLPKNFNKFKDTPKIVIEGDYHNYKQEKNWYIKYGIDMILHRHKINVERGKKDLPNIKHLWLPCSVDINLFKPDNQKERQNKLCFIGGLNPCYVYRKKAVELLEKESLIKVYPRRMKGQKYIEVLQSYVSHVNGSSLFDLDIAKMFEIMACGSVLFTDNCENNGVKDLFDEGSYVTYNRDFTDLIPKAKRILNDKDYREKIINKALNLYRLRALFFPIFLFKNY